MSLVPAAHPLTGSSASNLWMEVVVIPASEPCREDRAGIHAWGQHQAQRMLRSTFVVRRRLFGQVGGKGRPDLGAYPYLKFFSKGDQEYLCVLGMRASATGQP